MSDLAPFVAALVHDHTLSDLQNEVVALQAEQKRLASELARRNAKMIRVTGRGGFPIYAERPLENAVQEDEE